MVLKIIEFFLEYEILIFFIIGLVYMLYTTNKKTD
jgi:hypothetical protein